MPSPGLYAADGSINVTVVTGSVYTGLYAPDGSINVVTATGSTYVGAYHPCGAWWVTVSPVPTIGALPLRAPDGSKYVSTTPFTNGGQRVNVVSGSLSTAWYTAYAIGGVNPSVALDFTTGRYFDGTNPAASLASLIGGSPSVNSSGLLLNNLTLVATGALLTALQGAAVTISSQISGSVNASNGGIVSFGLDAPVFQAATNAARSYFNSTTTNLDTTNTADWAANFNIIGSSLNASGRGISLNGVAGIEDLKAFTSPAAVQIGSYNGSSALGGRMQSLAVYPFRVSTAQLQSASSPPAFLGNSMRGIPSQFVTAGNVNQFERTQPWTIMAAIYQTAMPTPSVSGASVISTNVTTGPAFPGYELFIDATPSGKLHVRIISNFGTNIYVGKSGSTNVCDGKWHVVAATYDGSSLASGIRIFVDGVEETYTVEIDALGSNSIVAAGQELYVGNQKNSLGFNMIGAMDEYSISNVVRSPAFIAAHATPATIRFLDANVVLNYRFEEGSGTTVADQSASGFTGTLSTANLWSRS